MNKTYIIINAFFISAAMCVIISCHNLNVTLENYIPYIKSPVAIERSLYYPDTIVCTLSVEDLNDSLFTVKSIINDSFTTIQEGWDTVDWPGNYFQINKDFDTKELVLTLPGHTMGLLKGMLYICDTHDASDALPFSILRSLQDTFTIASPDTNLWVLYSPNDTAQITTEHYISNLMLQFKIDSTSSDLSVGLRGKFGIVGDFCVSVLFGLKENINDISNIDLSFFVSTSPDTGEYSGINAGFDIYSEKSLLHAKAGKGLSMKSSIISFFTGNMCIERIDNEMSLYCWDENVQTNPEPLKTVTFPPTDTLYVHLKMSVDSKACKRICRWDNFVIERGQIAFK